MSAVESHTSNAWPAVRRWLLRIHLWIGIAFCIPFALLGITGSVLVYDDALSSQPPQALASGSSASPGAILNAGATARTGSSPASLTMPQKRGDPALVRLRAADGGRGGQAQIYVDPISLAVLGTRDATRTPFLELMHDLHGSLALGGATGRPLVGWLGVGMVMLGISGLALWWPKNGGWRYAIGIRKGARGFQFYRQLHASAGALGWIVFVIVSFSGVAICFPDTVSGLTTLFGGNTPPPRVLRVESASGPITTTGDQAVALALNAAPGTRLATLTLPVRRDDPYRITLTSPNALPGAPAVTVFVDPYRGQIADMRDPRQGFRGDAIMAWQRTVHDGRAFGEVWKFLVFAVGFLPPLFAVTGTAMWWMRRRGRVTRRKSAPFLKEWLRNEYAYAVLGASRRSRGAVQSPSLSAFAPGTARSAREHARLVGMIGVLAVHGILLSLYYFVGMPMITRVIERPVMVVMLPPALPKPLEPPPMPTFAPPVPYVPVMIMPEVVLETPPPPRETITLPPPQALPSPPEAPLHAAPSEAKPVMSAATQQEFAARLFAHLNRYKRYPQTAKLRHQEGIVSVRFTMDRVGHVLSFAIAKSSGTPSLDQEAREILQRAQPLPPIPVELNSATLDLVVPVAFSLR